MKKQGIFLGIPSKDPRLTKQATAQCVDRLVNYSGPEFYLEVGQKGGLNTPMATTQLCFIFDTDPNFQDFDWFFSFADDQTIEPEDIVKLLKCAEETGADIVGGLVTGREMLDVPLVVGNFQEDLILKRWCRNQEVWDKDVLEGRYFPIDAPSGVAMIHRRVIEAFRPDKNNGLPYWSFDLWPLSYDWRFFHRAKEKGFKTFLHCGVLIGHVGYDGFPNKDGIWQIFEPKKERTWTYYDCRPVHWRKVDYCQCKDSKFDWISHPVCGKCYKATYRKFWHDGSPPETSPECMIEAER